MSYEQNWKINEKNSLKNGEHRTVFWVKQKKNLSKNNNESVNKMDPKNYKSAGTYQGYWKDDKRHGYGIYIWPNGDKYEGDWADDKRHGEGTFWKKTAKELRKVYAGHWYKDLKQGNGVQYFKNGDRYEGEWYQGKMHGQGILYYSNNDTYEGDWKNGERCGYGTLTLANGDMYEGNWQNNRKEGKGIFYYREKEKIFEGEWHDTPRCGVYIDAADYFKDNNNKDKMNNENINYDKEKEYKLPIIGLESPEQLLDKRYSELTIARNTMQSLDSKVEELFEKHDLEFLKNTFTQIVDELEVVSFESVLSAMKDQLGFEIDNKKGIEVLQQQFGPYISESFGLDFNQFVKAVYILRSSISKFTNTTS